MLAGAGPGPWELQQTVLDLSFMPERRRALENLAERAPLPATMTLPTILKGPVRRMVSVLLAAAAGAVFLAAAVTDIRRRRIANGLVLALAVVAVARMAVEGGPVLADVAVALALFGAGVLAFRFGFAGGGDVKLMAAGALWTGAAGAAAFLLVTALAGGLLALGFLLAGQRRARLPYGAAIAVGGILVTAGAV